MWSDLLNGALSSVDWFEIAEAMIDNILENENYNKNKILTDK